MRENWLKEICGKCGFRYGSHHGGTSPWPRDYCPGHENQMDWENGPGTSFKPTGEYQKNKEGENAGKRVEEKNGAKENQDGS